MPYIAKSCFITFSFVILLFQVADLKAFFMSLMIFMGGILFDLYFSYNSIQSIGENWTVTVTKILIYVLSIIAIIGFATSLLGIADKLIVTNCGSEKYIIISNEEVRRILSNNSNGINLKKFIRFLCIECVSCLPDLLINKMTRDGKNKKKKKR